MAVPGQPGPGSAPWKGQAGRRQRRGAAARWQGGRRDRSPGPWITGSYHKDDDPAKFHDGWLRTGDVGTLDERGFIRLTDRAKDVIKSGGEWISSMELENILMAHPDVAEAAVIGIPDDKWGERPLAAVVLRPGAESPRTSSGPSWLSRSRAGSCPNAGASSPRSRRPVWASSPSAPCAMPTPAASTKSSRFTDARR